MTMLVNPVFATDGATVFNDIGVDATYIAPSGVFTPVKAIFSTESDQFGDNEDASERQLVVALQDADCMPQKDGIVQVNGRQFTLIHRLDADGVSTQWQVRERG